ncbi:MAG: sigma-70 family RNA polymerase sigma factor [Verrucomicrobiia bacterium]|jgi:RNA polymerase primary sigma factor
MTGNKLKTKKTNTKPAKKKVAARKAKKKSKVSKGTGVKGKKKGLKRRKEKRLRSELVKSTEAAEEKVGKKGLQEELTPPTGVPRDEDIEIADVERNDYDENTAIKLYLHEIGQVNLLTPQEEIELAKRIKAGDQEAREKMIKANLRLVVKIARDYENYGLPLLDLISEGNIGLMKAVERFDPSKGGKLSTYASWWIKQAIKRALANQSKTIRLPVHLVDKIARMRKAALRLQEILGREPTDEEVAEELGIPVSRVTQMRTVSIRPTSLDAPIGDDDSNNYSEIIADEAAITPYKQLEDQTLTSMLKELVKELDQRESEILKFRFGLDGGGERTLEEVGAKFGVTRERVRQIQNAALRKLRKMIEKYEKGKAEQS